MLWFILNTSISWLKCYLFWSYIRLYLGSLFNIGLPFLPIPAAPAALKDSFAKPQKQKLEELLERSLNLCLTYLIKDCDGVRLDMGNDFYLQAQAKLKSHTIVLWDTIQ